MFFHPEKYLVLSQGDTSTVYSGIIHAVRLAIKVRTDHERNQREARVLMLLEHENIVVTRGAFCENDVNYICLDRAEDGSLQDHLGTQKVKRETRFRMARQVCDAVAFMHEKGYIHRNLKINHVLIKQMPDPIVCIGGFGNAMQYIKGKEAENVNPRVPEKLATPASDVFCLAIVVKQILDNKLIPEDNPKIEELMAASFDFEYADATRILVTLVKAISPNPEERPTAVDLRALFD